MIECPTCRISNNDDAQYCDECGVALPVGIGIMPGAASDAPKISQPTNISTEFNSSMNQPPYQHTTGSHGDRRTASTGGRRIGVPAPGIPHAKLVIARGDSAGKEFLIRDEEAHIGRWDADSGIFPDIDLDLDDREAKVSRRHARILHSAEGYAIEDLGSTNGTFVNRGRRLLPGQAQPLADGDEIIVGKMFLRLQLL